MSPDVVFQIFDLPPSVLRLLMGVRGPGWIVRSDGESYPDDGFGNFSGGTFAWWPANPAAAVAAVLRVPLWDAHRRIYEACTRDEGDDGDDHAAALEVIEGHVRGLLSAMPGR